MSLDSLVVVDLDVVDLDVVDVVDVVDLASSLHVFVVG